MIGRILILAVGIAALTVMVGLLFGFAPADSDEQTDIIILMGQSNAEYRPETAIAADAAPVPEPGTAWYFGTEAEPANFKTMPDACGVWPMSTEGGATIGDKWPSLAAKYTEATGHNVYVFSDAWAGKSITWFEPNSPTGSAWSKSVRQTEFAMQAFEDAGHTIGRVSVLWIQGEQDGNDGMSGEEYKERMLFLFSTILNGGLGIHVDGPIWVCKVRVPRTAEIAAAQVEFCEEHPGMARIATEAADGFTIANGLMYDYGHFSQAGNNIIGEDCGSIMGAYATEAAEKSKQLWAMIGIAPIMIFAAGLVMLMRRN